MKGLYDSIIKQSRDHFNNGGGLGDINKGINKKSWGSINTKEHGPLHTKFLPLNTGGEVNTTDLTKHQLSTSWVPRLADGGEYSIWTGMRHDYKPKQYDDYTDDTHQNVQSRMERLDGSRYAKGGRISEKSEPGIVKKNLWNYTTFP
jgi:hypothetical protein